MKRKVNSILVFMAFILLFSHGYILAVLPDPIVAIDFNGDWTSSGTAGTDYGTPVEENFISPQFGTGILTECFDQLAGEFDEPGGAVVFGDTVTQTPMQTALSGLMSFTITAVVKMPAGVYGDPNHAGSVLFSALDSNGDHAIAVVTDQWNRLSLIVNNQLEADPYGEAALHWLGNFENDEWFFLALSYDGTVDPQTDPFDQQNVVCHTGLFSSTLHYRSVQNTSYDGVLFAGAVNDIAELVWIGNTADTATRWILDEVEGLVLDYDPTVENPATFAGKIEALRIYGSKTDASGVLTKDQLEQVRSKVVSGVCGGADNPIPLGDINGDCKINFEDFSSMAGNWMADIRP